MDRPELTKEIIDAAAEIFTDSETDVLSLPIFDNRPFPVSYVEFSLAYAAIASLQQAEISTETIAAYTDLVMELEDEMKDVVEDWIEITRRRYAAAFALNNYSRQGPFNPN